jgi:iron complex outermembrane receptor protein
MTAIGLASGAQAQPSGTQVQEVIVTVQRRAERLEEIPASVVDLRPQRLEAANVVNLRDISRVAPGVRLEAGGVYMQPTIRGITSLTTGIGNENNIAIYVDGFYVPDNVSIDMDLPSLESLQILKGPQGTLYGRNATGGAILINTLEPSRTWTGKLEAGYGRFNERRVSGYISGPIGNRASFIVSASNRTGDGWIRFSDPTDNQKNDGHAAKFDYRNLRAKLAVDLSEDLQATLGYNFVVRSNAAGELFTPFDYVPSFLPGGNFRANRFGTASYNHDTKNTAHVSEGTLKLKYATPIGSLTSYTSYGRRWYTNLLDFDGTYVDITYADAPTRERTFQEAVDYNITAIKHVDLVVGGMYLNDKFSERPGVGWKIYGFNLDLAQQIFIPLTTESYAFYADATIHLARNLSLDVGGRFSHDKKGISQITYGPGNTIQFPYTANQKSWSRFTPRAALHYQLSPGSNIYVAYSEGYRTGMYNEAPIDNPALQLPIKPERVRAYEVGFKAYRAQYRFETALFYDDYRNLDVSLTVPSPGCSSGAACLPTTIIGNAPRAKIYGLDAQATFTPLERLNIAVSGEWLHARYGNFTNAVGTGLIPALNMNLPSQTQDWTGKQMVRAPNFSANASADYTVPLAGGALLMAANLSYSGSYVIQDPSLYGPLAGAALSGKQRYRQKALTLLNAHVSWTDPSEHFTLTVYGDNLTNQTYRLSYSGQIFGDYSVKSQPISYGVKLGYKF